MGPSFDLGQQKPHRDLFDLGQNLTPLPPSRLPWCPNTVHARVGKGRVWPVERGGGDGEHPNLGPTHNNTQTHTNTTQNRRFGPIGLSRTSQKKVDTPNWPKSNWPKSSILPNCGMSILRSGYSKPSTAVQEVPCLGGGADHVFEANTTSLCNRGFTFCGTTSRWAFEALHDSPRTPNVHISGPPTIEKTPKRVKKEKKLWRESEKKNEILGLPPFGAPPFRA